MGVREGKILTTVVDRKNRLWLRMVAFLICIPSGGALLAKVYGIAPMKTTTLIIALPCCLALVCMYIWARKSHDDSLTTALAIGSLGGLVATLAYDLVRVPFALRGQRIYAPISAYGIWILDANTSSRFTELSGWAYHFSNGITFGIMYALFMRRRFWGWAILWAFLLETIALVSPFAKIFHLTGNYQAIAIAYFGHLAYGLPLGWMVYRWEQTREWMTRYQGRLNLTVATTFTIAIVWVLTIPETAKPEVGVRAGEFRVEDKLLTPNWLRLTEKREIQVSNPDPDSVIVRVKQTNQVAEISGGQSTSFAFQEPGIYQIFVETDQRTRSSFVIVEPVEVVK